MVRTMAPQREAESLDAVKKLGMKVNEIDVAPLQKAALAAQDELAKEFGAETLLDADPQNTLSLKRVCARWIDRGVELLRRGDLRRDGAWSACCRSSTASC